LIAGEGQARPRVADHHGHARQVAGAPRGGRHRCGAEAGRVLARALIVDEKEQPLPDNRPPERPAGYVLLALLFRRPGSIVLPGIRVEIAVPVELERVAAELVRPTFDDARDNGTADVADV